MLQQKNVYFSIVFLISWAVRYTLFNQHQGARSNRILKMWRIIWNILSSWIRHLGSSDLAGRANGTIHPQEVAKSTEMIRQPSKLYIYSSFLKVSGSSNMCVLYLKFAFAGVSNICARSHTSGGFFNNVQQCGDVIQQGFSCPNVLVPRKFPPKTTFKQQLSLWNSTCLTSTGKSERPNQVERPHFGQSKPRTLGTQKVGGGVFEWLGRAVFFWGACGNRM